MRAASSTPTCPTSRFSFEDNPTRLAICYLGVGYGWTLRTGRSGFTHLLVAVDKFTKWIEAKPIKNLDSGTAASFIRELTFRYGVPHNIITDNGKTLIQMSSELSALPRALGSTTLQSLTHSRTGKQKEKMVWSYKS